MIFGLFGGDKKRVAEMIAAARTGDTEKVKQLLSKGADINVPEPESGDTPLLAAIDKGQWATAEYLLKQRPALSLEDKNGNSPLYLAVSRGDSALAMVNLLLEAGAPVDLGPKTGDNAGATPLHIACATGANGCLESLLRHGASATKQIPGGATPLHTAAIGGDQRTIELLCKAGGSVIALNEDKRTPLHNCGITGNAKAAVALIEQGAPVEGPDAEGCTPLMRAVMKNHAEVAKVLLDHGANPDVVVRTDSTPLYPLFVAAMNGYDDVIRVLLDKGANVTAKVEGVPAPVDAAKHNGHEAAAKLIAAAVKKKKAEAKAEKDGNELQSQLEEAWTSLDGEALRKVADSRLFSKLPAVSRLSVLAVNGDLAGVNGLLAGGLKPDLEVAPTTVDIPPVVAASMRQGNVDVVGALVASGANPNVLRADGSSALLIASSNGDVEVVKALLGAGANPNHALPNGQTVLMSATVNGQAKAIDLLIDAGADVNAIFPEGRFGAFALALDSKKMRIALQLLRRGAQPSFGDSDTLPLAVAEYGSLELLHELDARGGSNLAAFGARAAFVAARNKDPEVLDYLLSHGVDLSAGNDLGYTPLILASVANHPSLVQRYVDRGDDLNARDIDGETALSLAIEKDWSLVIHILRTANAETEDYGECSAAEAMLRASSDGALGTILNLRDRGTSINCTDEQGNTPLMLAAQAGYVGVVRSLYHLGADINHKNLAGQTASNLAKEADQKSVLKTLMEFGADDALHEVHGINPPDAEEGSRKTIDMADMLMGRYSHPFKDKLPYDEPEDSDDSNDEDEDPEDALLDEDEDVEPQLSDEVSSKLDRLEELINTPHIRDKLPEGHHEGITDRINLVRSQGEEAVPRAQLDDLFELAELLASQPESEEPPPPLFEAAGEGDLQHFRKLIKAGADVKETMPDGTTLLMTAAENGHNGIVQELLKLGVDVNQRRQDTFSAFLIACFLGHDDVVKTLAKHGADVNAAYEIGSSQGSSGNQTALTVAAARGNCAMCALLLKLGADLNVVSDSGYTPLMWSLANGSSEDAAELLLKAGANPDPDAESRIAISTSTTPLILASTNDMTAIVKALLKRNVVVDKVDGDGWTALKRASNEGHEEVVTLLLKAGASPNIADHEGWTALINAAGKGHVEICKVLLKAGADVNATGARGRTPLLQAIGARSDSKALDALKALKRMLSGGDDDEDGDAESSLDLIKALLKAGANPNILHEGASLLAEAIENEDEDLIQLLRKHGAIEAGVPAADMTASDESPESPAGMALLAAASRADPKGIKNLLAQGAQVNYQHSEGHTALGLLVAGYFDASSSRAFRRNALESIDLLLNEGADPNLGLPPAFLISLMNQSRNLMNAMLVAGADVNAKFEEDTTPLMVLASLPQENGGDALTCFEDLLRANADASRRHESGSLPIHLAAESNNLGILKALLEQRPEDINSTTNAGITPLMMAATGGHAEAVSFLLKFGADRTQKDDEGLTAKDVAVKNDNDALVSLLSFDETEEVWKDAVRAIAKRDQDALQSLVRRNAFSSLSVDARLLVACALGDVKLASEMLQAGADPNKPCKDGFDGVTPLVMTVGVSRSVEVASLLIDAGADVNDEWSEDITPIFETTADQFYDLAKLLVTRGANVNVRTGNGLTPLMFAARNGASKCVELFLDAGADINAVEEEHGVGAFGLALNRLDLQLAEQLLARGAEPNFGSIETLPLAIAENGSLAFIHALEARGCNLVRNDQRGRMAFVSARNPDPEVFDYLLNHGADPSEGNDFGYTPLILAALNNHHHLIRRYLARGDDAAVRDVDGETALSLAIEKRHEESVAALREFHVEEGDYSALDPEAAMLKAAEDGSLGSILNLRDSGVPINCCDEGGNSPLMIAVRAGHHGVIRSLYHLGADINHRNHAGESALGLAKASDSTDLVNTLQEFGALDAVTGELGKLSAMFGGMPIYNAADTMFGRMSHPYKDKPPYDNEAADGDDESDGNEDDEEDQDVNESDEDRSDESGVGASIDSKLDLLSQVLDSDQVKEQLPEAVLEQLAQKLDHWRSQHEESELEDEDLAELNRLLGMFGLGEEEEAEEVERTPLFEAVHAQDLAAVRKIIKGGGNVNEVDGEGNTPLLIAVLTRNAKLVDELLKLGADPNKARPDGKGPLFGAVRVGEEKIVQTLLKGGAEVDAALTMDHNGVAVGGCTALYIAAFMGHLPCCKVLVSGGAKVDAASDLGYTPLMAAIDAGEEDVIDFLLRSGANVDPDVIPRVDDLAGLGGSTPLYSSTRKEDISVIKKLIKRGANVNRTSANGWTPLKSAAQQGNFDTVKVLLEAGADPNIPDDTNYTPLMNAVSGEHEDIVKILLKFNADPNVQSGENPEDDDWEPGRSALMDAAVSGNVAIARELLKSGANPNLLNSKGRTALHSAVISGNADMVALLLKSGADRNVFGTDDEKMSALDLALRRWASEDEDDRAGGISGVLELMLKKGMPSDRGSLNETALDLVTEGHLEVVGQLRKQGFTVDANYSKNGASQLFITAAIGDDRLQAAELLLKIGADPNYKSPAGLSVLSLATRNGAVRLAELLLKAGANVMDRNSANLLAYDLAVIYGHDELIDLLITHMNQVVPAVDGQADDGTTGLMRATMAADVKQIKDLLAAGADASRRDRQGESPLSYALAHDLVEVVQALRSAGVERLPGDKAIGPQSIVHAGSQGALGTILDLLDSGTPIDLTDDDGDTALTAAAVHPGVVKVLAKRGADLSHRNGEGKTAYMIAAASNRVRMVEALKEAGSPIDEPEETEGLTQMQAMLKALRAKDADSDGEEGDNESAVEGNGDELLMACLTGDALAVSRQLGAGADVNYENDEGRTPLVMAIAGLGRGDMSRRRERGFEQIVDSLLAAGADPNRGLMSALILATTTGRLHLVNAMLRAGADIDAATELPTDEEGGTMLATALFVALSSNEHGAMIDERVGLALLEAGPELSFRSDDGSMAVHCAAKSGMSNVLNKVLDLAPEVIDLQDEDGSTPLMLAAAGGHVDAINALLKRGASLEIRDAKGRSAAQIAKDAGHQQAAASLA